tara:strand:- start:3698 stop:4258 length:561 start_codon:yes stop_codon:yes gene_type:complete
MSDTLFGNAIVFLQDMGFFDVVLPFLLVFTIVFGILEKTKIFGTEGKGDQPKKNLNAMTAFVVAFFVLAAKEVVAAIQNSLPLVALVLLAILCFLMLIGAFFTSKEEFNFMDFFEGWKTPIAGLLLLSVIAIFLYAVGWMEIITGFLFPGGGKNTDYFIMGAFVVAMAGIVFYVVGGKSDKGGDDD